MMNMYTIVKAAELTAGDIKKLPENVRKAHEFAMKATKNGTSMAAYNGSDVIRKAVDGYLVEITKIMEKSKPISKKPKQVPKNLAELKRFINEGTKLWIHNDQLHSSGEYIERVVTATQTNSFASKGNDVKQESWLEYPAANEIEFTDKYFKVETFKPGSYLYYYYKKPIPKVAHSSSRKMSTKSKAATVDVKFVEDIDVEIRFINRYKNLHGKIKTIDQIVVLLRSLQRAITKKQISAKSRFAKEINTIQNELIKLVNKMEREGLEQVEVEIKDVEKYKSIAASEKRLLSVTYLLRFIALTKKSDVVEKSERLSEQISKAIKNGKIKKSDKYYAELVDVNKKLKSHIKGSGTLEVTEAQLNGLSNIVRREIQSIEGLNGFNGAGSYAAGILSSIAARYIYDNIKPANSSGPTSNNNVTAEKRSSVEINNAKSAQVLNSEKLKTMKFETIKLDPEFAELIGEPSEGAAIMIYGGPGSGKSTFEVLFGKSLAEYNNKKVLIITDEEGFSKTMQEKLDRLDAYHKNIFIAEEIPVDIKSFDVVFFDSVQSLQLTPEQLEKFHKEHPRTLMVFVFQVTKDGKFKGEEEFEHIVDVVLHADQGIVSSIGKKNRFGGRGELQVY